MGRGYRAPSLYERFGSGFDSFFGYTTYGDPRLAPEHSIAFDAGIDQTFAKGRVRASATYFYTTLQQVIAFATLTGPIPSAGSSDITIRRAGSRAAWRRKSR